MLIEIEQAVLSLLDDIIKDVPVNDTPFGRLARRARSIRAALQDRESFDKFLAFNKKYPNVPGDEYRNIQVLILLNRKIDAIKLFRRIANNPSLIDAKTVVENSVFFNQYVPL